MRVAALVAALGFFAAPLSAGVETRAADGRVRIEARAAPLSDVLDDLARHTGMKVVYEGAPPRDLVTATLERGTLAEALLAVFEGLDLTYVIQLDATGSGVAKLVMVARGPRPATTAGAAAAGRTASAARPPGPTDPVPAFSDPEIDEGLQEVDDPSAVVRDRVATDPSTGEPYPTPPDRPPEDAPQPPAEIHVQGYPTPGAPSGVQTGPATPFGRYPQGPSPQPQPTPAAP